MSFSQKTSSTAGAIAGEDSALRLLTREEFIRETSMDVLDHWMKENIGLDDPKRLIEFGELVEKDALVSKLIRRRIDAECSALYDSHYLPAYIASIDKKNA